MRAILRELSDNKVDCRGYLCSGVAVVTMFMNMPQRGLPRKYEIRESYRRCARCLTADVKSGIMPHLAVTEEDFDRLRADYLVLQVRP